MMGTSDEEYTMVWNEHANIFSISLSDLLQRNELVDVTLAGDGCMFNAHRLVLSVVSPYFQRMFTQLPVNQQAIVFMKDASKQILIDLITFIYTGEVSVKEGNLTDFLSIAKALEIKCLADGNYSLPADPLALDSEFAPATNALQFQSSQTSNVRSSSVNSTIIIHEIPKSIRNLEHSESIVHHQGDFDGSIENGLEIDNNFNENDCYMVDGELFSDQDNSSECTDDGSDSDDHSIISPKKKRPDQNQDMNCYNIVADIRKSATGRSNLFHNLHKFGKSGNQSKISKKQRWICTKNSSERCKASVSTIEVDGLFMMKVFRDEHTHEPQ